MMRGSIHRAWLVASLVGFGMGTPVAHGQQPHTPGSSPGAATDGSAITETPAPAPDPAPASRSAPPPAPNDNQARVTLSLTDPSPVIGLSGETMLTVDVDNPPLHPMPMPRILCSVGQIEDLSREGPARFTARYILPTSRFPQPAILVAEFPDPRSPLRGMVAIRLRAATTYSFRTDPGAQGTLRVGDRDFGPRTAGADGRVQVPVVVPPGVDFATARSVNQYGKSTEQIVDLRVPYSQRLLFAAPESLRAGAVGEVAVYAVEPSGRPANAAMIVLRAGKNRVHPLGSRLAGEARFLVGAPTVLRQRSMRIEAQLKDQNTTLIATRIALLPGDAAGLALEPEAHHLARSPGSSMRVFLGAEDAFGNPVDAGRTSVLVDGKPAAVQTDASGVPMVTVQSPQPIGRREEVVVEGVLDRAVALRRIPVGVRPRLRSETLDLIAYPRYTVTPRMGVLTNFGPLAGATFFVDGLVCPSRRDQGLALGLSLGLIESRFTASSASGISRTSLSTIPLSVQVRQHWVHDRAFAGVSASAGVAVAIARVSTYGFTTTGRSVGAAAEAAVEAGFLFRTGHLVASLRYVGIYLSDFSSGEHMASNAGGAMADLGYRIVW
jgi:hypothetical protein